MLLKGWLQGRKEETNPWHGLPAATACTPRLSGRALAARGYRYCQCGGRVKMKTFPNPKTEVPNDRTQASQADGRGWERDGEEIFWRPDTARHLLGSLWGADTFS